MSTFAFSKANHNIDCGGKIANSAITTTTIDMNGKVITSVGSAINPTDSTNKIYVDDKAASVIPTISVTLTGTSYVLITSILQGDYHISVKNKVPDGPCGAFFLAKSEANRYPSYTRLTSSAGLTTHERLDIRWDPGQGIELKKTGSNYNGNYSVRLIENT